MELHPEYIRDMHNHYMILKGNTEDKFNYTAKMLMNNSVPGILRTELRYLDSLDLYYYDITSKKTLKSVYESKSIDYDTTKGIIKEVLQIIDNSQEYLLIEHDFIVNPEFVFIDHKQQVGLCYMPGFSSNILEQLSYFFEYIMNKIDYKDESAVRLIYALYKVSKDIECTFHKLYEVINHPYTIQEVEKKRLHKDEPQVSTSQDLAINKTQLSSHYNEKLKIDKMQKKEYGDNYENNSKSKRNKAGRNKKYTTIEDKNKTIINNKN
ncbi:MAG: hypothetical protein K0S61_3523, partial [Anaerocolumna sp.]|nr:hypothetical protein [Anaerocolumna sp.]